MKISVALATYNGENYIEEQIRSILPQLSPGDEILVVDDCSRDQTLTIIEEIKSPFITVIKNEKNLGHVKTFEKLISLCKNEIIFMCDQDDRWAPNKVDIYKTLFQKLKVILISDNSRFINKAGELIDSDMVKVYPKDSENYSKNIFDIYKGTAGYYGCGMAFDEKLKQTILPIPAYVESHDLWIAMAANLLKSNLHIDEKTFYRRIHGENDSLKKRPFLKKIYSRLVFLRSQRELEKRIKNLIDAKV